MILKIDMSQNHGMVTPITVTINDIDEFCLSGFNMDLFIDIEVQGGLYCIKHESGFNKCPGKE